MKVYFPFFIPPFATFKMLIICTVLETKRPRTLPPESVRIMVYVRQETEDVYTPLHLIPPTVTGLIASIENKYKINASNIRYLYRKNKDGIIAKIDDDMLRHYCNEDVFLMQVNIVQKSCFYVRAFYNFAQSMLWSMFLSFNLLSTNESCLVPPICS